jgi:hypothetical protein
MSNELKHLIKEAHRLARRMGARFVPDKRKMRDFPRTRWRVPSDSFTTGG